MAFMDYILRRSIGKDLHFITSTTIDTLDYSGDGFGMASSKVIFACHGKCIRDLLLH